MARSETMVSVRKGHKEKLILNFRYNASNILRYALTGLFIGLAVWFFKHQRTELHNVKNILFEADPYWIIAGLFLVLVYIFLQGLMYVASFASVNARLNIRHAVILFLKRNFISVFIPAGGVSSLAFFNNPIEKKGISKSQIIYASTIYAFVGILSVVIVAVPAFLFAVSGINEGLSRWYALGGAIAILVLIYVLYKSLIEKGWLFRLAVKFYPGAEIIIDEIRNNKVNLRQFLITILVSVIIEFVGIAHVLIAMAALNMSPSLSVAIMAYIVVVLFLIISPFLRGLGAIEVSMSYLLIHSGFGNIEAIAITLLFRFFEFWLPLFAGIVSFLTRIEKLLLRIIPSFLIFALGIVNIISVLSRGTPEKLQVLRDYLFFNVISLSRGFVLVTGLILLVTATFMLRGLRSAWWIAIILSLASVLGHITKGINLPEAGIALFVTFALISTRKEYYVKTNPKIRSYGITASLISISTVLIYGTIGFYLLDKRHFQIDFSLVQSIKYTLENFFLLADSNLIAHDSFATYFLYTIKITGTLSIGFLIYSLIRPYVFSSSPTTEEYETAAKLVSRSGRSSLDYFKLYKDKQFFFSSNSDSFISYKVWGNFAVVLEDPVSPGKEEMKQSIVEFRKFCYDNGLKEIYYRVPGESLGIYEQVSKKNLFLGQEGVVDLSKFTLEGGDKKSIRNAINKIKEQGYSHLILTPPIKGGVMQKLKSVSEDWLKQTGRKEITFSQGIFAEDELRNQTILAVETKEEKVIAFLNIIPDYAPNEGTYDLLRKTSDAPNGIMDYMLVQLFSYFKSQGIQYVNLGFAPISGLNDANNFTEKSMKFAYERIKSFSHFKGQREYKEKFQPVWYDKYLIYDNEYDLLSVPAVLGNIIKV